MEHYTLARKMGADKNDPCKKITLAFISLQTCFQNFSQTKKSRGATAPPPPPPCFLRLCYKFPRISCVKIILGSELILCVWVWVGGGGGHQLVTSKPKGKLSLTHLVNIHNLLPP